MHGVGDELGGPPLLQLALVHADLAQHPADVAPEEAVLGRVEVLARLVGLRVVDAVHGHPRDRPALARQHAGEGAEVLERLRHAEAAVGQEAVVGQADPDRAREPPEGEGGAEPGPGERPRGEQGAQVQGREPAHVHPVELLAVPGQGHRHLRAGGAHREPESG